MAEPQPAEQTGVLVVENNRLLAFAIAKIVEAETDLTLCGVSGTGGEAVKLAGEEKPHVVVMDFRLPDMSGPGAATLIRNAHPEAVIVFHSADECETGLLDAIDAGASVYLTKDATAEEIIQAVRRAARGEVLIPVRLFAKAVARRQRASTEKLEHEKARAEFTPRELDVLYLLAEGLDTATMSEHLGIAHNTVEWHVRHLIEKLEVHSKLQAVIEAASRGLIDL